MFRLLRVLCFQFVVLSVGFAASAEVDAFHLGDGRDGRLEISSKGEVINAYGVLSSEVEPGSSTLCVSNVTPPSVASLGGFVEGRVVLLHQSASADAPLTTKAEPAAPFNLHDSRAGTYELARVASIAPSSGDCPSPSLELVLGKPVVRAFAATGTQVVTVPEFSSVTVRQEGSITARPFDGQQGGLAAFLSGGEVRVDGVIDADGKGFRGGEQVTHSLLGILNACTHFDDKSDKLSARKGEGIAFGLYGIGVAARGNIANAAGGGNCTNAGGGGGGHGGRGGAGGKSDLLSLIRGVGGIGGAMMQYDLNNRMIFGGGGGAGEANLLLATPGTSGGGIVFIRGGSLSGGGRISANGTDMLLGGLIEGGGGAGAGGGVVLRFAGPAALGTAGQKKTGIQARGGAGGTTVLGRGAGGGGGGGRILLQASNGVSETPVDVRYGDKGVSGLNLLSNANGEDGKSGDVVVGSSGLVVAPAPAILSPADGSVFLKAPATYSGTATPGAKVWVILNETKILGPVSTNGLGAWSVSGAALPRGSHSVQAAAELADGTGGYSEINRFRIAPPAPVLSTPTDESLHGDATVDFGGIAEEGGTVIVEIDGAEICRAQVLTGGTWSCAAEQPIADGEQVAVAITEDEGGHRSESSDPVRFVVDTTPPDAPVVNAPADGDAIGDDRPVISGTAEVASLIEVYLDGASVCQGVITDEQGEWECVSGGAALAEGPHEVYGVATDAAGNVSPDSSVNTFQVILTLPKAPVLTEPAEGQAVATAHPWIRGSALPGVSVQVYLDGVSDCVAASDGAGEWSCEARRSLPHGRHVVYAIAIDLLEQRSARSESHSFFVYLDEPASPVVIAPADGTSTREARPTISGLSEPGFQITAYLDGAEACQGIANLSGEWICLPSTPLSEGEHLVHAIAVDPVGQRSAPSAENRFWVYLDDPSKPTLLVPEDGSNVDTARPRFEGQADPRAMVEVFVDEILVCQATTDVTGQWSCTSGLPLSRGRHVAYAVASDPVGRFSEPSDPISFGVYAGAPQNGPEIDTPADGSVIKVATPRISGRGDPNAALVAAIDGESACSTTIAEDGSWECVSALSLSEGNYTVDAVSTDPMGNVSPRSLAHTFTVDFSEEPSIDDVKPTPPVITSPEEGEHSNDPAPVVTGTAEEGTEVEVFIDGNSSCVATAGSDGSWSCRPSERLNEGEHEVVAVATGAAGIPSEPSAPIRFTVDTTDPEPPTIEDPTGNGDPIVFRGTAEPRIRVQVTADGEVLCTAEVSEQGRWTCEARLPRGEHKVEATATDRAGNQSPPTSKDIRLGSLGRWVGGGAGCSSGGGAPSLLSLLFGVALALSARGRKWERQAVTSVAALAILGLSVNAEAQAKLPGFELERLRINPSAQESLVIGSGDLLERGGFRLALAGHYQHNPLLYESGMGEADKAVVGARLGAQLSAAFGITHWLEAGAQIPVILLQRGDRLTGYENIAEGASMGTTFLQLRAAAMNEVRGDAFDLGAGVGFGVPLGSAGALSQDDGISAVLQLEGGRTLTSWLRFGGNAGMVLRPKQAVASDLSRDVQVEVGNEFFTGLALTTLGEGLRGELAAQLQLSLVESPAASEVWAGVRYPLAGAFELYALAGPGFGTAPGTPSFRTLAGVAMGAGGRRASRPPLEVAEIEQPPDEDLALEEPIAVREEALSCGEDAEIHDACHVATSSCGDRCTEAINEGTPLPVEFSKQSFYFETGKTELSFDGKQTLNRIAEIILAHPALERVLIEGHTDSVGSASYNIELSYARAESVRSHLETLGVPPERMETRGYAFERPAASNRDDEGRSLNRRAEIFFLSSDGQMVLGR